MLEKNAQPIETLIDFAWAAGADRFWVNNAKDELKKLREKLEELIKAKDSLFNNPIAWARINDRGDLYDLRLQNNPYNDQTTTVPLYRINHE